MKFWREMKRESDADEAAHLAMGAELAKEYPDHLPVLAARVASLASLTGEKRAAHLQVWGCLLWPPIATPKLTPQCITL